MICPLQINDLDTVASIWLDSNISAHSFIPKDYWESNFAMVKDMLSEAELYVYEDDSAIQGFIGLSDTYIEGIFVTTDAQGKGIGKQLLDFAKSIKPQLTLKVYQKNTRAIHFYKREGFSIQEEGLDVSTGEKEYTMCWQRPNSIVFRGLCSCKI